MLRLDFYVQHLVRQNATAVHLASGEPVRFRYPDGDRASNVAIEHAQVVQLVQEAAPGTAMDELRRTRRTSFQHAAVGGVLVRVEVDAARGTEWRVAVRPESDGGAIPLEAASGTVERITSAQTPASRGIAPSLLPR